MLFGFGLLLVVVSVSGFFEFKDCGISAATTSKNLTGISLHSCEDGIPVTLSCKDGHKIAVLYTFFGHGHGHVSNCDNSWWQNCDTRGVVDRVKYLCQNKQRCFIRPTSEVLGSTSCMFGLDADLHIKYTCVKAWYK